MDMSTSRPAGVFAAHDTKDVIWLRKDLTRKILFHILSVVSLGTLYVVTFFYPNLKIRAITVKCDASIAEFVSKKCVGDDKLSSDQSAVEYVITPVEHFETSSYDGEEHIVSFEINCFRYLALKSNRFRVSQLAEVPKNMIEYLNMSRIYDRDIETSKRKRQIMRALYGDNVMTLPDTDGLRIFLQTALSPFYLFQYFATVVWFLEEYFLYSMLILVITFSAVGLTTREQIQNLEQLRTLAGKSNRIKVLQASARSNTHECDDTYLVPGDAFLIEPGMQVPCDAILVLGKVIVDESMLTGESIPVNKSAIDAKEVAHEAAESTAYGSNTLTSVDFSTKYTSNVLFAGTKVRACHGEKCVAVTYKTGFRSMKGQLVASLLKPREGFLTFFSDAIWVMLMMFILATAMYASILSKLIGYHVSIYELVLRYCDVITVAIPPALTACLTIATTVAVDRLRARDVFVSDTMRVNWAGLTTAACFDKTGTLTEDDLKLHGVVVALETDTQWDSDAIMVKDAHAGARGTEGSKEDDKRDRMIMMDLNLRMDSYPYECVELMATCHSLSVVSSDHNDLLCTSPEGDQLEVAMFRATGWALQQSKELSGKTYAIPKDSRALFVQLNHLGQSALSNVGDKMKRVEILRTFPFTPEKMRSASLVSRVNNQVVYYAKGTPEIIESLCDPSSIPPEMPRTLLSLGKQGYRVIALAFKELSTPAETAKHLKQDDVEADGMTFLGLCVFSSSLKIDAIDTVATLQRANIHVCMITGDHVQTAISVARDCGILNSTRAANTSLSATASFSASSKLYVVDADPMTGDIVIVHDDAEGESCVVTDLTLSEILDQAAAARWLSSRHHFRSFSTRMKNPWAQDSSDDNHRPPHKYTSEEEGAESALMSESSPLISNDFDPSRGPTKTRREALSVEIAVTGKGLKAVMKMHSKSTIDSLIRNSALFSRTKPADKKLIVERLQNMPIFDERVAIVLKSQQPDSAPQSPSKHPHSPLSKRGLGLGGELRYGQAHYESEGEEKVHGERDGSDIFPDVESAMRPSRMTSSSSSGMHSYSLSSKIADHGLPVAGMGVDTTEGHHSNMNAEFAAVRRRGKFHAVFCGDGANDMSALREATIGVSLCDAETSVAAPITSKRAAPRSVIDVIMEGRCSLITAYSLVIFNILYAVIQLNMSCKLYSYALEAGDYMYLIQDMMYSLLSGIVISLAPANEALSADLPPTDFFNAFLVTKLVGQIILFMVFQWAALRLLTEQSWFKPYIPENPLTDTYSYEATTIDCVACAQLVIASIVSTIGMPFRYPWYRSKLMVSVVFVQTAWAIFQIFCTAEISADLMFLQLRPLPTKFAIKLFLLCVGNAVASFAFNGIADAMR